MKSATSILAVLATLITSATAHGWVGTLTIAGKSYKGNSFGTSGFPSVIRQITTNSPVLDTTSPDIICGPGAPIAAEVATANAGDDIDVDWVSVAGNWFHNVGPLMTYLASCGDTPCNAFDASKASWFKIQEQGQDSNGDWAQAALDNGSPAKVTLPSNLAAGNYLLRHEIIALQNGVFPGRAEFYPSCSQLKVSGSGTGKPSSSELVKFPGAYSASDPGILVDVYNLDGKAYQFPGPPVAAFVSGKGSPAGSSVTASTSTSTSTSKHLASSPPATSTKAASSSTTTSKSAPTASKSSSAPASTKTSTCKSRRRRATNATSSEPLGKRTPTLPVAVRDELPAFRRHIHSRVARGLSSHH